MTHAHDINKIIASPSTIDDMIIMFIGLAASGSSSVVVTLQQPFSLRQYVIDCRISST
jgi:hypothetical protein